jgi:hypothetical protein
VGPAGLFPQPDHWKVLTLDPPQLWPLSPNNN